MLECVPVRQEIAGELGEERRRVVERGEVDDLAADMHVDAGDPDPLERCRPGIDLPRTSDRHAELVLRLAGRNLPVGLRVHVGVDPDRNRRLHALGGGDLGERREFRFGFHVEAQDPAVEREGHLRWRLGDSREHDALARDADRTRPAQLALRDDIHPRPEAREGPQHRLVGVRLHGIAHERVPIREGVREHLVVTLQGRRGIAVERGADLVGQSAEIDVLRVHHAVAVGEVVHGPVTAAGRG